MSSSRRITTFLRKKLDNADEAQYIERVARDSLGLIKPGEKVYVDASPGD